MDGKLLARLAAVIFVAVALTATAVEMARDEEPVVPASSVRAAEDAALSPLRAELTRCQEMGEAAARNPACLSAWAEHRRRFLGLEAGSSARRCDASVTPATEVR
ncbi:putative entry exclusion protein TrbK-alt [Indioceanicola profundi]|uniref:putative entry exclusion protein TrbK-alt n=1 Tax=Indioceanicola profundi TaxID=2220096 RepID=UPI000E6AA3AD|nr:putative entry exclusion protein TrbK-alt [Indioceanicola profundi]